MLIANFWKYVSAAHGMHSALASSAYVTSRQMHVDTPACEVLSAAKGAQVSSLVLSVACEYLPAAHPTHVLVSDTFWPATHMTPVLVRDDVVYWYSIRDV
jgi:hypothetical protein